MVGVPQHVTMAYTLERVVDLHHQLAKSQSSRYVVQPLAGQRAHPLSLSPAELHARALSLSWLRNTLLAEAPTLCHKGLGSQVPQKQAAKGWPTKMS
jgi:hypothetical protein